MRLLLLILLSGCAGLPGAAAEQPPGTLRVMAYNIKHGRGMDGKVDWKRAAAVIAAAGPDLVALQEVDKNCTRSGGLDLAAELGKRLGMEHRFAKFMDFQGGEYGLAILSRFPIEKSVRHPLPPGAEPRCALEVVVRPPALATPLSFVSIHHDWTEARFRIKQVEALHAALRERPHPVILAGDFNGGRSDPSVKALAEAGWVILGKDAPAGAHTFPSGEPRKEIDFVMTRKLPPARVTHRVLDERLASDHRPIEAVFVFWQDGGQDRNPKPRERNLP